MLAVVLPLPCNTEATQVVLLALRRRSTATHEVLTRIVLVVMSFRATNTLADILLFCWGARGDEYLAVREVDGACAILFLRSSSQKLGRQKKKTRF